MISCMGGWCSSRNKCQHYFVQNKVIVERLCGKVEEPESIKPEIKESYITLKAKNGSVQN